jgi:hypothetical protein
VAGCCECGDEPSGSCATELVSFFQSAFIHSNILTGLLMTKGCKEEWYIPTKASGYLACEGI